MEIMDDEKNTRIQNLFKTLQKDPKSAFYTVTNISNNLLKKNLKSTYEKDKVFVNLYQKLEDKNFYQKSDKIPLTTPFFLKKKQILIDRHSIVLVNRLKKYMQTLQI